MAVKDVHSLWVVQDGEKGVGVLWIVVCGETCEILSVDWFGKMNVTLEPILVDSYPWLGGDLLLRLRTTMSNVGWNILVL
jgi:hypothetical protein